MTVYGQTTTGAPVDDAMIDAITAESEAGFPDWKLKPGRPSLSAGGSSPPRTVRLPAGLDQALVERAARDHTTPSAVLRQALHAYLRTA
jgi:hypothetical protein